MENLVFGTNIGHASSGLLVVYGYLMLETTS